MTHSTKAPLANLRGLPALPSMAIHSLDVRGLDLTDAERALRNTLAKMGLPIPVQDGSAVDPEAPYHLPGEYLLTSFTQDKELMWVGVHRELVVEPHPQLGGHPVRRLRNSTFYSSTLQGVVDAFAEHERRTKAA